MVKTYQLGSSGKYGSSIKIAPVTTETETNALTCLKVDGSEEISIEPQSILPSTSGFECTGQEVINGLTTEKWQLHQTIGQKTNKYTLWMRWKTDPKTPGLKYAVPIRYEMKGFNSLLGSHYDHYYLEYDYYSIEDIAPETFQIDSGEIELFYFIYCFSLLFECNKWMHSHMFALSGKLFLGDVIAQAPLVFQHVFKNLEMFYFFICVYMPYVLLILNTK